MLCKLTIRGRITIKSKKPKSADWLRKELLVSDLEEFKLFVRYKGWIIVQCYEDVLQIEKGGVSHIFYSSDKWVKIERRSLPLVISYTSGFGREKFNEWVMLNERSYSPIKSNNI